MCVCVCVCVCVYVCVCVCVCVHAQMHAHTNMRKKKLEVQLPFIIIAVTVLVQTETFSWKNGRECTDYIALSELHDLSINVVFIHLLLMIAGGAKVAFQKLVFSASNYLLSLSSLPDFELVLW